MASNNFYGRKNLILNLRARIESFKLLQLSARLSIVANTFIRELIFFKEKKNFFLNPPLFRLPKVHFNFKRLVVSFSVRRFYAF